MALIRLLHEDLVFAAGPPIGMLDLDARDADAAIALRLTLLDREGDFARPGIAAHDLPFRTEEIVLERRHVDGRAARRARRQCNLRLEDILIGLHRRVAAHDADEGF